MVEIEMTINNINDVYDSGWWHAMIVIVAITIVILYCIIVTTHYIKRHYRLGIYQRPKIFKYSRHDWNFDLLYKMLTIGVTGKKNDLDYTKPENTKICNYCIKTICFLKGSIFNGTGMGCEYILPE